MIPRTRDWIAVDDATLTRADDNPGQFKPSVKVLPGGAAAIPEKVSVVDASTPIVKGTPLLAELGGRWFAVTVLEVMKDGSLRIHFDEFGGVRDQFRSRESLLIAADTLAALKQPNAAEKFAGRAERARTGTFHAGAGAFGREAGPFDRETGTFDRGAGVFGERQPFGKRIRSRRLHDNPIDIPIPGSAVRVTGETPLEEGAKLGACWGRKWWDVTVLEVNDNDTVRVHWDRFPDAWDGDVSRENLIITKKELSKVRAKAKHAAPKSVARADEKSNREPSTDESRFRVVLRSFGSGKIAVTRVVVDISGLDLKEAKEFVESAAGDDQAKSDKSGRGKDPQETAGGGRNCRRRAAIARNAARSLQLRDVPHEARAVGHARDQSLAVGGKHQAADAIGERPRKSLQQPAGVQVPQPDRLLFGAMIFAAHGGRGQHALVGRDGDHAGAVTLPLARKIDLADLASLRNPTAWRPGSNFG